MDNKEIQNLIDERVNAVLVEELRNTRAEVRSDNQWFLTRFLVIVSLLGIFALYIFGDRLDEFIRQPDVEAELLGKTKSNIEAQLPKLASDYVDQEADKTIDAAVSAKVAEIKGDAIENVVSEWMRKGLKGEPGKAAPEGWLGPYIASVNTEDDGFIAPTEHAYFCFLTSVGPRLDGRGCTIDVEMGAEGSRHPGTTAFVFSKSSSSSCVARCYIREKFIRKYADDRTGLWSETKLTDESFDRLEKALEQRPQ